MNKIIRSSLLGLLVSGAALITAVAQAEQGAWEKLKAFTHTQKEQAVAEGKKILAATDKQIDAMKKDATQANAQAKAVHDKNMAELAAKRKAAEAELARLEKAAAGTWDATKDGTSKAYRDLHEAYQQAAASAKK